MSSRNHFTKMDDAMKEKIDLLLYEGWSPEQIHGRLKYEGVDIVSHETIYKYVYEDKRLKGNGKDYINTSDEKDESMPREAINTKEEE